MPSQPFIHVRYRMILYLPGSASLPGSPGQTHSDLRLCGSCFLYPEPDPQIARDLSLCLVPLGHERP